MRAPYGVCALLLGCAIFRANTVRPYGGAGVGGGLARAADFDFGSADGRSSSLLVILSEAKNPTQHKVNLIIGRAWASPRR